MNKIWLVLFCLFCVACSNTRDSKKDRSEINDALTSPLKDLNLIQEKIPAVLLNAQKNPYGLPVTSNCSELEQQINELSQVLAPDIDQNNQKSLSDIELGVNALGDASIDAIKRTTESVIPYRSWVRKLTGAEQASKVVANAIKAGNLRRAFLKGFKASVCSK